jgi:hypothetical protein
MRGATGYEVAVFRVVGDGEEPVLVTRASVPGDARGFTPAASECLERGGRYAWSVAAVGRELRWSQPFLFEVESAPSLEEVEDAIALLERHRGELLHSAGARDGHPAVLGVTSPEPRGPSAADLARQGRPIAAAETSDEGIGAPATNGPGIVRVASAAVPSLGDPSLRVSANLALDDDSNVFQDEVVFLWDDASGNTALGRSALATATGTASNNTAIGRDALRNTVQSGGGGFFGSYNTAVGDQAMRANTVGFMNAATGFQALYKNNGGARNVANGYRALYANTAGVANTAVGANALRANTNGTDSTAIGYKALEASNGSRNTALGSRALLLNSTGFGNTAVGYLALRSNTTGDVNVAHGYRSLFANQSGDNNTAVGVRSLQAVTTGDNTAIGYYALAAAGTGEDNTAVGTFALDSITTGSRNTAVGHLAGGSATTGSDNIFVGSGALGTTTDTHTIRIGGGTPNPPTDPPVGGQQNRAFIAGIRGITTFSPDTLQVLIDATGQLGTAASSLAVKQDVHEVGPLAEKLLELRPVAFRYKQHAAVDPDTPLQFGLIAEQVAEVFPELVVFDGEGKPETVKYHLLSSLLLELVRQQQLQIDGLEARLEGRWTAMAGAAKIKAAP